MFMSNQLASFICEGPHFTRIWKHFNDASCYYE